MKAELVELIRDSLARTVSLVVEIAHFDGEVQRAFFEAGFAIDQRRREIVMVVENSFEQGRETVVLLRPR